MIHINAFIKLSLNKMDKTALTISKTRQGSILAEGSIFTESTLLLEIAKIAFSKCVRNRHLITNNLYHFKAAPMSKTQIFKRQMFTGRMCRFAFTSES